MPKPIRTSIILPYGHVATEVVYILVIVVYEYLSIREIRECY